MKYLLMTILLFSLYGCGDNSWESYDNLYDKIHNWQDREMKCSEERYILSSSSQEFQEVNVAELEELRQNNMNNFQYVPDDDGNDYWQTSCETQLVEEGDCEDFAIMVLSKLRIYCPNYQTGVLVMTYIRDGERRGHAVAIIYHSDSGFLILDRNWGVITGEDLRKKESLIDLKFKLAFNLEEIWII